MIMHCYILCCGNDMYSVCVYTSVIFTVVCVILMSEIYTSMSGSLFVT